MTDFPIDPNAAPLGFVVNPKPASTAPLAAGLPHIQGRCPACGTGGLFLADGGYITCSLADCPQPDAATEVIADFWEARQHAAFTFCDQSVGHVTMTAFAKKVTEKVTAVAQRASAVEYANEQKQRAEQAEVAVERVRALHVRNVNTGDCEHCSEYDYPNYSVPYPCQTITALDGPAPAAGHTTDTKEQ